MPKMKPISKTLAIGWLKKSHFPASKRKILNFRLLPERSDCSLPYKTKNISRSWAASLSFVPIVSLVWNTRRWISSSSVTQQGRIACRRRSLYLWLLLLGPLWCNSSTSRCRGLLVVDVHDMRGACCVCRVGAKVTILRCDGVRSCMLFSLLPLVQGVGFLLGPFPLVTHDLGPGKLGTRAWM